MIADREANLPRLHRKCPVCWRSVNRTPMGKIGGHFDKARNHCPASWETYTITIGTP